MRHSGKKVKNQGRNGKQLFIEQLEPRLALDASALRITELVASNDNSLQDYDGESSDWLEIYNSGATSVDLTGMHLTDNANNLSKWTFPAGVSIPAGGYRVVFASSKNTVKPNGELHTNFALSAGGEYLGLIDANGTTVIDQYTPNFPAQVEDVSYGRAMQPTGATSVLVASGALGKAWVPTSNVYDATWKNIAFNDAAFTIQGQTGFGYENAPGDAINYTAEIKTTIPSAIRGIYLRIPFTLTSLAGIDRLTLRMKYDDGFAAYVNGIEVADGNAPETTQWNSVAPTARNDADAKIFQDIDVSSIIPHLVIGQNMLAIHAMNNSTTSADFLVLPELVAASSTLVAPDDFGYFDVTTPGYGNPATNFSGFVADPAMSVPHGFYSSAQSVALSTSTPGATIVYTTNNSTPTMNSSGVVTNGTLYTGPINISSTTVLRAVAFKTDFKPSFVTSASYLFLNDIVSQSPTGQVPPGFAANGTNGQSMDYGIDPDIINLYGAQAVKDSLTSIPSISISTDTANLFNAATGIYVNANNRGREWERPATIELIDPDGSEAGFTVNAGLRIRGGYSRNDFNPKHAFRFYFRSEYGDGKLDYALFGDEGADEFDVLDLRADQNYSWSSAGDTQNTFVREVFARDTMHDLGEEYTRSRYYHLYVDGVYWGLFQTQERVEEFYGETYFGGSEEDYDVVKHGLGDVGGTELSAGNDVAWRQLFDYGQAVGSNPNLYWTMQGLNPDGTRNPALPVLLDVDNLIDFMSIIVYTGGYDSGISAFLGDNQANNWFGIYNRATADRGFQFYVHDNEHSLGAGTPPHSSATIDRTGPFNNGNQNSYAQFNPQYLHQDLLANAEYRQAFIDHIQKYFFNAGALTSESNLARFVQRADQVEPAVIAEAARWGDAQSAVPLNKSTWEAELQWIYNTYFPQRAPVVLNQLRADGLFTSFAAPTLSQGGGEVAYGYALTISGSGGTIYYTTDGVTDPRLIGGGINPSAQVQIYAGGNLPITADTTFKIRLRTAGGQWSGLVEAKFFVAAAPGDANGDDLVDGADILAWQRSQWSDATIAGAGADSNYNSLVDSADLAIITANFGVSNLAVPAATPAFAPLNAIALDAAFAQRTSSALFADGIAAIESREGDLALARSSFRAAVRDSFVDLRNAGPPAADDIATDGSADAAVDAALEGELTLGSVLGVGL